MGSFVPSETRVFLIGLIFEIKTDWLPSDIEITLFLHSINDPPGRHPTPWSDWVNPELYIQLDARLARRSITV